MNCSRNEGGGGRLGWADRYFVRRFALARRMPTSSTATAFSNALFEVTLVAVALPCLAVYSCVLVTSLKWAPNLTRAHPNFSPKLVGLVIGFLAAGAGHAWFRRRFRRFLQPPDVWVDFDTERDRRIVFWQKLIILSICGAVIPVLAVIVTFSSL